MSIVSVHTPLGDLIAEPSTFGEDYPGISISLRRNGFPDLWLGLVEYTETESDLSGGHLITRIYGDAVDDEYTDRIVHINIESWFSEEEDVSMLVHLTTDEYDLICDALNNLSEAREDEMKWAAGDPDIIECDQDCIDSIERLLDKLGNCECEEGDL